jgi:hypothetical protein
MKMKQLNNDSINPFMNKAHIIQDKEYLIFLFRHYVPRRLDGESLAKCYRGKFLSHSQRSLISDIKAMTAF